MEIPDSSLFWTQDSGFEVAMTYKTWGEGYDLLKEEIQKDREGYVIKFKNGFRMKIKGEEYKRLHKILTNFSSKDIWELLRDGKPMDEFLDRVPDEFYKWVKQQVSSFEYAKYRIGEHCGKIHDYFRYGKYGDVDPEPTKKDFALHLEKCDVETFYRPILFAMWDGKPYEHIIWRIMKPKYEKPFKKDEN
jgi:RNA ligase